MSGQAVAVFDWCLGVKPIRGAQSRRVVVGMRRGRSESGVVPKSKVS